MSQTAETSTPELVVVARKLHGGPAESQDHEVMVWAADSGEQLCGLKLRTYKGEIVRIWVIEADQLRLY